MTAAVLSFALTAVSIVLAGVLLEIARSHRMSRHDEGDDDTGR